MADLSKIKLNGIEYNLKDTEAREALQNVSAPPVVTTTTNGLMLATDKQVLDNLNPNISVTISNLNINETHVINAKQENLVNLEIIELPHIESQIRTSNLLNVNENITIGYYIGSNGTPATNANDIMGDFIPVTPGQDIYYTGHIGQTNSSSINRRLHVYNSSKTWIKQMSFAGSLHIGDDWSTHATVPSNGAYVRVSWGSNDTNVMISVGAPIKYEPYYLTPFDTITSASFLISPDNTYTDADTYTITVPVAAGNQYGFTYNPITGKLYGTTGHIAAYNGETLPGVWWSDRDTYVEGNSPSTNAEVVYMLDEENIVEYNFTPLTIPLFYHTNYIKTNNGLITTFTYYAETLAADHFTVYNGVTFGNTDILENNVTAWNHAADEIDLKAPINAPIFTGAAQAVTTAAAVNNDRIATTAFVQQKMNNIAPFEANGKASKDYAIGQYIYTNGQLYKVTTAIPKNASIIPGNNVDETDVATELNLLFSLIT